MEILSCLPEDLQSKIARMHRLQFVKTHLAALGKLRDFYPDSPRDIREPLQDLQIPISIVLRRTARFRQYLLRIWNVQYTPEGVTLQHHKRRVHRIPFTRAKHPVLVIGAHRTHLCNPRVIGNLIMRGY
jgi:hypothetical protein